MIFCKFNYCIYNKGNECILEVVSISPQGMCDDYIILEIEQETFDKYKKQTLHRLESKIKKRREQKKTQTNKEQKSPT